jgi:hypothetical protein
LFQIREALKKVLKNCLELSIKSLVRAFNEKLKQSFQSKAYSELSIKSLVRAFNEKLKQSFQSKACSEL